uniref:Ulp1 protease family, C-terminal catalytic domain-containing protein n=1 Tax=Tanacetum cinerariifolium TaxID=118510 RepID=A0A6L2J8G1_TANCI|nr:hypothetical protein [Tanacetum cinerariifolium]
MRLERRLNWRSNPPSNRLQLSETLQSVRSILKGIKNHLHSKHAPPPAKPLPPPRNPILRSAKHAPLLANPKPKAPKLKPSDVTEFDQGDGSGSMEGDGSGSEEEGDEEEDEKKVDEEEDDEDEDEKEGDGEEDEKEGDDEEDKEEGDEKDDDEEKVDEEEYEGEDEEDAIVNDEEYEEEEEKKDSESSSSEDEKPLKKKTKGKGKGPSKPTKKVLSDNQIRREKFLSDYLPLLSRTLPSSFFHAIRDAKVNMKSFMEDIGFSALHSVNIDTLPNRLARFVVRAFDSKTYNFYLKTGVVYVTAEKLWLSQFAPKKKKRIFATDIAEKLVRSTRVDFMFKVNFLMLFANVMGKADTMRAFVNLSVVRRIREDTNIVGLDWFDFIHRCLAINHEPNTSTKNMSTQQYLEIEDDAFGKIDIYREWSENETVEAEGLCENASVLPHTDKKIIYEMIEEKISRISKEKAEVEILLRDANKQFLNDDNVKQLFEQYTGFFKETVLLEEAKAQKAPQNVKPKPAVVKTKDAAEKPKSSENVKELAEKPKEPDEKAQEAPQNVKPKPAAVKTKKAAEKPKPTENPKPAAVKTKEAAEKPMPAENVKELSKKPKEPAGDDYQIEGNIDWVGEDELHDWPRVVEPVNMVQPSTPKRVFSLPSKGYVKPVKTVNTPYMCRRIDVTTRCKRIEFVLGNSLFAAYPADETVFQSLGGYRELSLVFFPIYASDHFYVMVFNIKKPKTMVILDNSDSGYGYASKYKEACDPFNYVGDAAKNWGSGLCEESDEQLSMLQRMRCKTAIKIMLHQFNAVSNKMFDFAWTKYTEQARVSMIVDAIKNKNNRDPPKQVKETDAANVVVGVNEVVDQVKEKRRRKK